MISYCPGETTIHSAFPIKQLFTSITDLVEVINLNRVITWSNHHGQRSHPVGDGNVIGAKCFDLYKDICHLCDKCPLERLFQDGEGFSVTRVISGSDDEKRKRWVRGFPIFDEKDRVASALKISFNITDEQRVFQRLREDNRCSKYPKNKTDTAVYPFSEPLSHREHEVLRLVAEGFSNRQIAELLKISAHTVKSHVIHIFNKLGVSSRTHAAALATRLKII